MFCKFKFHFIFVEKYAQKVDFVLRFDLMREKTYLETYFQIERADNSYSESCQILFNVI